MQKQVDCGDCHRSSTVEVVANPDGHYDPDPVVCPLCASPAIEIDKDLKVEEE